MSLYTFIKRLIYPPCCPFCNAALPLANVKYSDGFFYKCVCDDCRSSLPSEPFARVLPCSSRCVSPLEYKGKYKKSIIYLKRKGKRMTAVQLSRIISECVADQYGNRKFDLITCVPLSKKQKKLRGYNQSELIAVNIGQMLNIPFDDVLDKLRENSSQHTLSAKERKQNVKDIYYVPNASHVAGKSVLLIDDIVTTGFTLSDCVRALYEAGACSVYCATAAITQNYRSETDES